MIANRGVKREVGAGRVPNDTEASPERRMELTFPQ